MRSLPGVRDAAIASYIPMGNDDSLDNIFPEGQPNDDKSKMQSTFDDSVQPGYFRTAGTPVIQGREFTEADATGNPRSIIISAETAHRFFPKHDAVGKHIRLTGQQDWCTIVGVANDVRAYDLRRNLPDWMDGMIYVPYGPGATREDGSVPAEMTLVLRSSSAVPQLEQSIRSVAASLNPEAPVSEVIAMPQILSGETAAPRSIASLFAAFAALRSEERRVGKECSS